MAKGENSNPMIRILVLGAHGVGKSCLESRFTTGQWPPSYDPSLTLCSRRFYTFQYGPERKAPSVAKRIPEPNQGTTGSNPPSSRGSTTPPSSASSSKGQDGLFSPETPVSPMSPASPTFERSTQPPTTSSAGTSISDGNDEVPVPASGPTPCAECLAKSQTHLVEIINYPALHHTPTRHQVLSRGEYDAVVLVYDVGSRPSFEHVKTLHSEIRLLSAHPRRRGSPSAPTRRRSGAGSPKQQAAQRGGGLFSLFAAAGGAGNAGGEAEEQEGQGEVVRGTTGTTVVAIVGNKCDLDGEGTPGRSGEERDGSDEKAVDDTDYAIALFGRPLFSDLQRVTSTPPTPWDSRPHGPRLMQPSRSTDTLYEFLQVGRNAKATVGDDAAAKEVSAGTSSSDTQPEVHGGRQVSNVEGEGLALELATQVPFFEVSAKTGENVEEVFEAAAKAVLREMGRGEVDYRDLAKRCAHRNPTEGKNGATRSTVGDVAPRLGLPLFGPTYAAEAGEVKNINFVGPREIKGLDDVKEATVREQIVESQSVGGERQLVRRRESVVEKVRKIFKRKGPAAAEGLAV